MIMDNKPLNKGMSKIILSLKNKDALNFKLIDIYPNITWLTNCNTKIGSRS